MHTILFVNACVNRATSRTLRLARVLLERLTAGADGDAHVDELVLEEADLAPLDSASLDWREGCIARGDFSDPRFNEAKRFAAADEVVVAAPYWDLSFPSQLKVYCEHLCVRNLTFEYTPQGRPLSRCHASRLHYVTTAGGYIGDRDLGFDYIRALMGGFFGIADVRSYRAEGLDIAGNDAEAIFTQAVSQIRMGR